MKLTDAVFYREYDGETYIYDTAGHYSHFIPAPASEILDLFREDFSVEAAIQCLCEKHPDASGEEIGEDVEAMADFLLKHNMLQADPVPPAAAETSGKQFQRYTIRKCILFSALLEITYRCPEKCVHCYLEPAERAEEYRDRVQAELSAEEIYSVLDQLAELKVLDLTITGGEPFYRKDCFDILEYAKGKGFATSIYSNAILLSDSDLFRLASLRINCFHASLYSCIPEKHDRITGIKGSFQKTTDVLRKLAMLNVYVNIKFVLMEQNKDDLAGMIGLAREIGASLQLISCVSPSARGNCGLSELSVRAWEDLKKVILQWNKVFGKPEVFAFSPAHPVCEAGRNDVCINPYGVVTPCNALPYEIGNIREQTVRDIWYNSRALKKWQGTTRGDIKGCGDCQYAAFCNFCPGNAMQYSGDMLQRYEEACRQARVQYEAYMAENQ